MCIGAWPSPQNPARVPPSFRLGRRKPFILFGYILWGLSTVLFPSGARIDGLGAEAICMQCHQGLAFPTADELRQEREMLEKTGKVPPLELPRLFPTSKGADSRWHEALGRSTLAFSRRRSSCSEDTRKRCSKRHCSPMGALSFGVRPTAVPRRLRESRAARSRGVR